MRVFRMPLQSNAAKEACPYYQVNFSRKGKSSAKFVRKEDLPAIRKQLKSYENMKMLVDRWIDLATELSNLRLNGIKHDSGRELGTLQISYYYVYNRLVSYLTSPCEGVLQAQTSTMGSRSVHRIQFFN